MKQIIIILVFLISFTGFSQEKDEIFKELKNSKLYVFMYDTTETDLEATRCQVYNKNIREILSLKRWDFCSVEYVYFDKLESFLSNKGESFLMIPMEVEVQNNIETNKLNQRYTAEYSMLKIGRAKDFVVKKQLFKKNAYVDFKKSINTSMLASFNTIDLCIGVDYMQKSLYKKTLTKEELKEMKIQEKAKPRVANIEKLKSKTLLVDKSKLEGLDEAALVSIFNFPVKITTASDIEQAVKEKRSNITFLKQQMWNSATTEDMLMIIDNDDFSNLGFIGVKMYLKKYNKEIFEKLKKAVEKG